jgi:hypothetical protein
MCTLTYLPTRAGFLFTSNRDEDSAREQAIFPGFARSASGRLLMPLDPQGGGTWILACENGEAACLLNGAFVNHHRKPPYRKSRGRVIVESFDYHGVDAFLQDYDFEQIEPFTLVRVSRERQLHEIRWDGHRLFHQQVHADIPHIWSSVTLYDEPMRAKRKQWFEEWLAREPDFTGPDIRSFHLHGGEGDPEVDFRMTRSGGLQTLSLTCLEVQQAEVSFFYQNLMDNTEKTEGLSLRKG